jgi:hypothetical protein
MASDRWMVDFCHEDEGKEVIKIETEITQKFLSCQMTRSFIGNTQGYFLMVPFIL